MAQQQKTVFSEKDLDDIAVVWAQALQRKLQDLARAAAQNWHDKEEKKNEVKRLPRSPAFLKRLSYFLHPENQRKARAPVSSINSSGPRKTYSSPVSTAPEVALSVSHSANNLVAERKQSLNPIQSDPLPVNQSHAASDVPIPQKHLITSARSRVRGPQERDTYSPQPLTPTFIPKIAQEEQSEPQQSEFLTAPPRHISYHGPSPPVIDSIDVKHGNMPQGPTGSSPGFFYGAECSPSSFSKGDLFNDQWLGSRTSDSDTLIESPYYDGTSEASPLDYRSLTCKPLDFDSWAPTGWVNAPTSNSQNMLAPPTTQEASRHRSPHLYDGSHPQNGDVEPSSTGFSVQQVQQDMEPQQLLSRFPVTATTPNVSRNDTPMASGPELPSCLTPQPHSAGSNPTVTTPISDSQFQPPQQYLDTSTAPEHRHLDHTTLQRLVTEPTIPAPPTHPTQHQKSKFQKRKLGEVDNEDGLASIRGNGIEASAIKHPTKKAKYLDRTPKTVRGDIK